MKKSIVFILSLICLLSFFEATAQKKLSVAEAVTRGNGALMPPTLSGLSWVHQSYDFVYYATSQKQRLMVLGNLAGSPFDTLQLSDFNRALKIYNNTIHRGVPIDSLKVVPGILSWLDANRFRFLQGQYVMVFDRKNKSIVTEHELPSKAEHIEIHDETGNLAFVKDNKIAVKPKASDYSFITDEEKEGLVFGQSVHRNEFGINKGLFWSPKANKLAFYRMDESMVTQYPMYDLQKMPAQGNLIRYPFAGDTSHQVSIGVYDLNRKKTIFLKTGKPVDQYLTNISWSPNEKFIYVAVVDRSQKIMWFKQYNAETGDEESTLFSERNEKYVEPENPALWLNKNQFVWQSERDGFNHLYLYDQKGKLIKQLTTGNWQVNQLLGTNTANTQLYFTANKDGVLDNRIYRINLSNSKIEEVSKAPGSHMAKFSADGRYCLNIYSNPSTPAISQVIDCEKQTVTVLLKAENPLNGYQLGETKLVELKSTDGSTNLYGRLITPANFDPTKKYPVIVYVYGGPHLQLVRNSWLYGSDYWMQYMAQEGYVVFSLDNRGSANRGFAFESAVHRQLGELERADQMVGVNYLKSLGFVDSTRMGVFGWSFGGFMTTGLMTHNAGTFKAGVAGGPVIDWAMYEIMYTERYMETPNSNPDGYKKANLLNHVEKLKDNLLLIHGSSDDVVLWQHSLLFVKKAVEKGIQLDYFVYPEHAHNVSGRDRIHLYQKVTNYFNDKLR